jgi:hypothetical protein
MDLGTFYREFQNPPQLSSLSIDIGAQSMAEDLVRKVLPHHCCSSDLHLMVIPVLQAYRFLPVNSFHHCASIFPVTNRTVWDVCGTWQLSWICLSSVLFSAPSLSHTLLSWACCFLQGRGAHRFRGSVILSSLASSLLHLVLLKLGQVSWDWP